MQNTRPVAAIVSTNELFTPAHVSLESCLLQRLTVYRMEMWEEAVNVFCERVACVKDVRVGVGVLVCKCVADVFFCSVGFFLLYNFMTGKLGTQFGEGWQKC